MEGTRRRKRKSFETIISGGLRAGRIASYTAFPAKWQARRVGSPPNATVSALQSAILETEY